MKRCHLKNDLREGHHNDNEITPGEDDPTVNDNVKFPVLNDHGDIEYKSQQGSVFKRHKNDNSTHETESTEENKKPAENNDKSTEDNKKPAEQTEKPVEDVKKPAENNEKATEE
ncbi:unnamed protein product [Adineta steineri]|uniref:Uncharacterized protein n=1 Tax=Adineta steineri TaxID=433720 RepID=A0A813R839_9BILA|nr:unnamed protein product [Adineta steineri]